MELLVEMLKIVWPILLAGAIGVFVILRLKSKFKGKNPNDITREQIIGSYFMPFGMILGAIYSLFSSVSLVTTVSVGPSIGFLFGYVAYEVYSRKGEGTH